MKYNSIVLLLSFLALACSEKKSSQTDSPLVNSYTAKYDMAEKLNEYKEVKLLADLSELTASQKKVLSILIDASDVMDDLFWKQTYGDKSELLSNTKDEDTKKYIEINYGPWDRLSADEAFLENMPNKPLGANFYPKNMSKEAFESFNDASKTSQYTIIKYNKDSQLVSIPYHEEYYAELKKASDLLKEAAGITDNDGFKKYLLLRSEALLNSNYQESDMAWMDMKDNLIDVVIGPIENYEDQLFNYKTAFEAYVLLKDVEWSKRLEKYIAFLPELQSNLPVPDAYKMESPGTDSDLNAYNVLYYAGNCNSGGKTIAINLPNDEEVQLSKGTRRLQLKNAMRAKFDEIMLPISQLMIDSSQISNVTFDAFFANTMFHEVAHGLGIKNTINGNGPVRKALQERASAIEEGKADILGLFMIRQLNAKGVLDENDLMDNYVTFLAGIFRSIRFGSTSAHGMANMIRFNYFQERNAFTYDKSTGRYFVNRSEFESAIDDLSKDLLILQGNGDYQAAANLFDKYGVVGEDLKKDLKKINDAGIPKDIVFEQGKSVLGI